MSFLSSFLPRAATLGLVSLALTACSPSDEPETSAAQNEGTSESAATSPAEASDASAQPSADVPSGCENLQTIYGKLPQGERIGDFELDSAWCGGFHAVAEYINAQDGYEFHVQVLDGESRLLADEMDALGEGSESIAGQMADIITKNGESFVEATALCEEIAEAGGPVAHMAGSGVCVMEDGDNSWTARKVHDDDLGLLIRFYAISSGAAEDAQGAAEQLGPLFDEFSIAR